MYLFFLFASSELMEQWSVEVSYSTHGDWDTEENEKKRHEKKKSKNKIVKHHIVNQTIQKDDAKDLYFFKSPA